MREIKFRVWSQGKLDYNPKFIEKNDWNGYSLNGFFSQKSNFIFQQFTGIKTRDGKEIYEGDIVQFINPDYVGIVEFVGCQYLIKDLYEESCSYGYFGCLSAGIDYKILGNVYENPELLIKKEIENPELDKLIDKLNNLK